MSIATDRNSNLDAIEFRFTPQQKRRLRRRLLAWYANHARDLPWRRSRDPYRVWVSEIMLQQTQVATVREYFERFVSSLPDVQSLADADEQRVLRLWEGLGYYRRARQLHEAARQIVSVHGGKFPTDLATLQSLPGIGRYTAGAIASIAFGKRAPILEANTIRLLSRLIAYRESPLKSAGQRALWQTAEDILPRVNVAQFNQALMELGSLVCSVKNPNCAACPLAGECRAFATGRQGEIPRATAPQPYVDVREATVAIRNRGRVLLRQCGRDERWAGLWDFPRFVIESDGLPTAHDEIVSKVREQTGITCAPGPVLKTFKHGVTRYRITLDCYQAAFVSGSIRAGQKGELQWATLKALADYPLSTTGRKFAQLLCAQGEKCCS